jgi:hypothetical protein
MKASPGPSPRGSLQPPVVMGAIAVETGKTAWRDHLLRHGSTVVLSLMWLLGLYPLWAMECPLAHSGMWRYGLLGVFEGREQPDLWWLHTLTGDVHGLGTDWRIFGVTALATAVWTAFWLGLWRLSRSDLSRSLADSRLRSGHCSKCGYDLRGTARAPVGRCPECGSRIERDQ